MCRLCNVLSKPLSRAVCASCLSKRFSPSILAASAWSQHVAPLLGRQLERLVMGDAPEWLVGETELRTPRKHHSNCPDNSMGVIALVPQK